MQVQPELLCYGFGIGVQSISEAALLQYGIIQIGMTSAVEKCAPLTLQEGNLRPNLTPIWL